MQSEMAALFVFADIGLNNTKKLYNLSSPGLTDNDHKPQQSLKDLEVHQYITFFEVTLKHPDT